MQMMMSFIFPLLWICRGAIAREKRVFLHAAQEPTLSCVGWKKTLNCDPSGPRDPKNDKDCTTTVTSEESGFCECGDFTKLNNSQFGAVPCTHPPFTCDVMCLKFSVLSGIDIEYQGATLTPTEANDTLSKEQHNPFDLDMIKKYSKPPPIEDAMKAFATK